MVVKTKWDKNEIARDAQMSQPTVYRYLNILETTHLLERLPAYLSSHTSRLMKTPIKIPRYSPGLLPREAP